MYFSVWWQHITTKCGAEVTLPLSPSLNMTVECMVYKNSIFRRTHPTCSYHEMPLPNHRLPGKDAEPSRTTVSCEIFGVSNAIVDVDLESVRKVDPRWDDEPSLKSGTWAVFLSSPSENVCHPPVYLQGCPMAKIYWVRAKTWNLWCCNLAKAVWTTLYSTGHFMHREHRLPELCPRILGCAFDKTSSKVYNKPIFTKFQRTH